MNILLVLIICVVVAGLAAVLKTKQAPFGDGLDFVSRNVLYSPAERSFLGVLEQALDNRYRVFGKVRLGDIVMPAKGLGSSRRMTALNRINRKHVDFVVCRAADLALVGVLELDDLSHGRDDRIQRDGFVDRVLAMSNIPVVHFLAARGYAVQEVRARLAEILPGIASTAPEVKTAAVTIQPAVMALVERALVQDEAGAPV